MNPTDYSPSGGTSYTPNTMKSPLEIAKEALENISHLGCTCVGCNAARQALSDIEAAEKKEECPHGIGYGFKDMCFSCGECPKCSGCPHNSQSGGAEDFSHRIFSEGFVDEETGLSVACLKCKEHPCKCGANDFGAEDVAVDYMADIPKQECKHHIRWEDGINKCKKCSKTLTEINNPQPLYGLDKEKLKEAFEENRQLARHEKDEHRARIHIAVTLAISAILSALKPIEK